MLKLSPEAAAAHAANRASGLQAPACYAPFTSMYFDQFGTVLACCINNVNVLGSYPEQSISDIWNGTEAGELRAALLKQDFSLGCHDCHSSISSKNYFAVNANFDRLVTDTSDQWLAEHPPVAEDHRDPWPRMLEFALSTRCNLTCTMCSGSYSSAIRKAEGLDPLPEIYSERFVAEVRPFLEHVTDVRFYGGEPFLAPVNFLILEALCEVNPTCKVSITTNGTIWNERVERIVEILRPNIVVSIDAFSADGFEAIRRGANRNKVFDNLSRFSQVEGCKVSLAACAMRQNWRELPDLVRFANSQGLYLGFNVVLYPQDHSLSSADASELTAVIELWESLIGETKQHEDAQFDRVANENLGRVKSILSEVRGWLSATEASELGVNIRSKSASAAFDRRHDWLELLAALASTHVDDQASLSEDSYRIELDRLIAEFNKNVSGQDQGQSLAFALSQLVVLELDAQGRERFAQFAQVLALSPVGARIRRMADLPPGLIAQGVMNLDPKVMAARLDSFFPPEHKPLEQDSIRLLGVDSADT
ncbi:MAG: radical SAM protein [Microthrixaceae bacterium]